jgi:hypothetical protein
LRAVSAVFFGFRCLPLLFVSLRAASAVCFIARRIASLLFVSLRGASHRCCIFYCAAQRAADYTPNFVVFSNHSNKNSEERLTKS